MPDHDPGLQRHHVLPRQLLGHGAFMRMFAGMGRQRYCFEDFRENGVLLPCDEAAALRLGLPLHRGPHPLYTKLVVERVGQIEAEWSRHRDTDPDAAATAAHMRLNLLQRALRRYLLAGGRRVRLNRRDPLGAGVDFSELDGMADGLWASTQTAFAALPPPQPMPARPRNSSFAD